MDDRVTTLYLVAGLNVAAAVLNSAIWWAANRRLVAAIEVAEQVAANRLAIRAEADAARQVVRAAFAKVGRKEVVS